MNNARRTRIDKLATKLSDIIEDLEALGDEEMEAFENLPESLQYGERGEAMQLARLSAPCAELG